MPSTASVATRFWDRVDRSGECWLWTGARSGCLKQYGAVTIRGRRVRAHRFAYQLAVGSIPTGRIVRHRCDEPLCVRPEHLELGTQTDNNRDRDERGRQRSVRGEDHARHKLTVGQVRAIRQAAAAGQSIESLAREYPVCATTVRRIVRRAPGGWRWVV